MKSNSLLLHLEHLAIALLLVLILVFLVKIDGKQDAWYREDMSGLESGKIIVSDIHFDIGTQKDMIDNLNNMIKELKTTVNRIDKRLLLSGLKLNSGVSSLH